MTLFLILLTVVSVVRSIPSGNEDAEDEESSSQSEEETTDTPAPSVPVFSGGILPATPHKTENTKTIAEDIASGYAALINSKTGEIVAALNSDVRFSPASMTKVMTLIVACETLTSEDMDTVLTMTSEWYNYSRNGGYHDSTLHGIDVNDAYKIKDLLYGIGMKSASDCVVPIIFHIAGSEEAFVSMMNQKVAALGLHNTHFDNAIGYDSVNNYTTAEDMAVIMAYAMQSEMIADILGRTSYASKAAGYNSHGEYVPSFDFAFYSSLFGDHSSSRMTAYKNKYGTAFTLTSAKLLAGKTGWTPDNYCLVSYAQSKSNNSPYVLVLGRAAEKHQTMKDVKDILDTYVK